jgi:hypothetical protein
MAVDAWALAASCAASFVGTRLKLTAKSKVSVLRFRRTYLSVWVLRLAVGGSVVAL